MNKIILLGRLTKKPEIRFSQATKTKVALFTLAVNRRYVKPGEERETDFINIISYSKLAEFSEKYLSQGIQVNVVGSYKTVVTKIRKVIQNILQRLLLKKYILQIARKKLMKVYYGKNLTNLHKTIIIQQMIY